MLIHQQAGKILANAFLHYPLMLHAFEGKNELQRAAGLQILYTHCSKAALMYGGVCLTADAQGALIWLAGKNFPMTITSEVKSGMAAVPLKLGLKTTLRLITHDSEPDKWLKKNVSENFGYVWCVGVKPEARGKGHSRKLIEQSITDMQKHGMEEFWLKTEDPKNVAIYQKLGFETAHHFIVQSSGIPCWVMRKKKP